MGKINVPVSHTRRIARYVIKS